MGSDEVSGWLGELQRFSKIQNRSEEERGRVEELCRLLRGARAALSLNRVHPQILIQ